MTSTISLNKINAVLKKNFRLNAASIIVTNLLAFIGALFVCYTVIGFPDKSIVAKLDVTDDYSSGITFVFTFLGVIQFFFLAIKIFREIYSRRASDSFYSMPVTRKEYYTANVLFGLINIAFLFIVVTAVTLIFAKTSVLFDVKHNFVDLIAFFKAVLYGVSLLIFALSGFILAAVLCGRRWQVFAVSVVSYAAFCLVIIGSASYMNTIYGFGTDASADVLGVFLSLFNGGNMVSNAALIIAHIVLALVVFVIGYFVFKSRKAEVAEQSLSGKIVPVVLLALVCAAVYITFSDLGYNLYLRILIGIIACFAAAAIFCAVFYKKFLTKASAIAAAAVCIVMSAFIIGVDKLPQHSYVGYVPQADEVQSVKFTDKGESSDYLYSSTLNLIDSFFYDGYSGEEEVITADSQDSIESIIKLHTKAISSEEIEKYNANLSLQYTGNDYIVHWYSFKIEYKLKNGKTVTRRYSVDVRDFVEEYAALIKTDNVIEQRFPFTVNKDAILFGRVEDNDTEAYDAYSDYSDDYGIYYSEDSYFTLENYDELFNLIKTDIKARNSSDAAALDLSYAFCFDGSLPDEHYISIYYLAEDTPADIAENIRKMTPSQVEKYMYEANESYVIEDWVRIDKKADKNTFAFLEEKGIIK